MISVDDLIIRDVEQTLRLDIEERCKRWQKVVIIAFDQPS